MKKLLIPIDGSEDAQKALLEGRKLAETLESEVLILYVEKVDRLPGAYTDVTTIDLVAKHEKIDKQVISDGLEVFKDYSGVVNGKEEVGNPAEVIIQVAEKENVDLIVMGSRGLSGIKRFILGSVSNKVLNHAPCSVLIIR